MKIPQKWVPILQEAAEIVRGYVTGVTLRQLYYRLVALGRFENLNKRYKDLSSYSAIARREGWFPRLLDRRQHIHRFATYTSPAAALAELAETYRRDRTEGQEWAVYLGVEKAGIVEQLMAWFGDYGVPILALGGYASQSHVDLDREDIDRDGRRSVLLYAGDWDPSGEDIDRDYIARVGGFTEVVRIALTRAQVAKYNLPHTPGKTGDSRAKSFVARHGALLQVELDALPPDDLRTLYDEALTSFWDEAAYTRVMDKEAAERAELEKAAERAELSDGAPDVHA